MTSIMDIREQAPVDVLDYQQLAVYLRNYAKPRDRISAWLADGSLIRVRKGLYILGERYRRAPVRRDFLANLIYGPSYPSLEYALSFYNMIPERVENLTSITTGANRRFNTPLGIFTYKHMPQHRYTPGVCWLEDTDTRSLMATPEKALVDKVWTDKRFRPGGIRDFDDYLIKDLRIDEQRLSELNTELFLNIAATFSSRKINMLVRYLIKRKGKHNE